MKKTYIGYDLGDGETITTMVTYDDKSPDKQERHFMTMPGRNERQKAIPTAYAYDQDDHEPVFADTIVSRPGELDCIRANFKRKPTDLLGKVSESRRKELEDYFYKNTEWPSCEKYPELYTDEMLSFKADVINFTNIIFNDKRYKKELCDNAGDTITFCVGHPTKWKNLDACIYKAILKKSEIGKSVYGGKPASLVMAAESRAAFLYLKDKQIAARLPRGKCVLLLDVGSSTIDLTAMGADSRTYVYNNGNNYLGARGIDYLIQGWYMNEMQSVHAVWERYQSARNDVDDPRKIDNALTVACRMAKEQAFSSSAIKEKDQRGKISIEFGDLPSRTILKRDINYLIDNAPIEPVLREHIDIPYDEAKKLGDKSWRQCFEDYLKEEKVIMDKKGLSIDRIIITGSASKMDVVPDVLKDVFGLKAVADMEPSMTIANGLALVGPSDDKSKAFQNDFQHFIDDSLPEIIKGTMPELAKNLSREVQRLQDELSLNVFHRWQERPEGLITYDDLNRELKSYVTPVRLNINMKTDPGCNKVFAEWNEKMENAIKAELSQICRKYDVTDFDIEELTQNKISDVKIGNVQGLAKGTSFGSAALSSAVLGGLGAVAASAAVTAAMPTILTAVYGIPALFTGIAAAGVGAGIGGVAGPIGAGIGLGIGALIAVGRSNKNKTDPSVKKRKEIADGDFLKPMHEQKQGETTIKTLDIIEKDILSQCNDNVSSIVDDLRPQMLEKADDIKYVIEAK